LFSFRKSKAETFGGMGQDELVLRVAPDPSTSSRTSKQRDAKTDTATLSKQRSHSRESSGASNMSVKFTVQSDGSASPKASVTTPYQFDSKIKSCLRKKSTECDADERREHRRRKHLQRSDGAKSDDMSNELFFVDSDDSLNVDDGDRLTPDLNEEGGSRGIRSVFREK